MLANAKVPAFLHIIADGRDVSPQSIMSSLAEINSLLTNTSVQLASISGRYFAMDRDQNFERTEKAYQAMMEHIGNSFISLEHYIEQQYAQGIHDEFIVPAYNEMVPNALLQKNDAI
ncbi:unnamed protein product [Didymodactylos carnosus]|uniref:phosphoglycerate mutase (2,3-diphosphoglycerate-independent) n=1 Tax=Didymodactylos carnosus TaxID=1234261 RepID=A0A8S2D7I9_9BILA|nr:unnamed protein product [Didymodactylos carnosus]CAF3609531.1 unnamed protein product [Didymodactylos carnosus]